MIKKTIFLFAFIANSLVPVLAQHNPEITVKELKEDVNYLASDSLKGRKPGTPEIELAAEFIRKQFAGAGLKLLGDNGYQYFEIVTDIVAGENNSLTFQGFTGTLKKDFIPLPYSSNNKLTSQVVFAGYGFDIDQDSLKWKDYQGMNVKGKWVMILRADPDLDNNESKFIQFGDLRSKILTAKDNGAGGVLVVSPAGLDKDDKLMALHTDNNDLTSGIPVIHIKREVANQILKQVGKTVEDLEKSFAKDKKPNSFEIPFYVTGSTDLITKKAQTENIVGVLESTDPLLKNEYIVIGGHYDHLGFGGQGSGSRMPDTVAIHNGADDNASGASMVMELAGKLNSVRPQLGRSIVFICFSAEEMGLIGSKYFVDHPLVDLKKVKTMFNFDMIGRFDKEKNSIDVGGTGTSAETDSLLKIYEKDLPFKVTHSPDGFGPSDHASFYSSNIPVFFFFTGSHMDYHTPFDDANKLDYETEKKIGDFAYNIIMDVDKMSKPLSFREAGKKESYGRSGRRFKVTLGIMPDFAGSEKKGLRVDGVTKDGPADKGGMKKGDVITDVNGMKVENIYDYMARLGKLKQGEIISVTVIRENKNVILIIHL